MLCTMLPRLKPTAVFGIAFVHDFMSFAQNDDNGSYWQQNLRCMQSLYFAKVKKSSMMNNDH